MSGDWFTQRWGKWWSDTDKQAIEAAKANGNEITPMSEATREKWRQRLQPVIDDYLAHDSGLKEAEAKRIYGDMLAAVKTCE